QRGTHGAGKTSDAERQALDYRNRPPARLPGLGQLYPRLPAPHRRQPARIPQAKQTLIKIAGAGSVCRSLPCKRPRPKGGCFFDSGNKATMEGRARPAGEVACKASSYVGNYLSALRIWSITAL